MKDNHRYNKDRSRKEDTQYKEKQFPAFGLFLSSDE
jgi:hypothetical protein